MTYVYRLAGEKLKLGRAEIRGLLRSQNLSENLDGERIVQTTAEPDYLKRLSRVHEVSKKILESNKENIRYIEIDYRPSGSFSVRMKNFSDHNINIGRAEKILGEKISTNKNSVDLEDPETIVKAYKTDKNILIAELKEDINRGLFEKRKNQNRPFSSPVSLNPVLARTLVNLAEVKPSDRLLDPFCGTGGILIEAGLCGIGVTGYDIQKKMVKGTEQNLGKYGILSHTIKQKSCSEIKTDDIKEYDCIVTDLPYGNSSKKTEGAIEDFLNLIEEFDGTAVFVYNEKSLGDHEHEYSIYVHKNLTRYIFID